ncbi:MAG: hypothetical protein L0338_39100 [Acidobacteria bacterium]|nr:hypothetical protein [Acidobacteriota bacterium]
MKGQKKPDGELNRLRSMYEHLFGGIDEIPADEAEELLRAAGIDPNALGKRMYDMLASQANAFRMKGQALPPLLEEALEDLRPESARPRTEEELKKQASGKLSTLLTQLGHTLAPVQLSFAYRNKQDLSEKDKRFLDSLAKKVEERTKGAGDEQ